MDRPVLHACTNECARGRSGAMSMGAAALLLAVATMAQAAPPAPALGGSLAAVPGSLELRIDGGAPGTIGGGFIGQQPALLPLPGGAVLGVDPAVLLGFTVVDADGAASVAVSFPTASLRGLALLGQGFTFDLATMTAQVSPVAAATIPALAATADVYVLFGQSNAEGAAPGSQLPPQLRGPLPGCRMWVEAGNDFAALQHGANAQIYGAAASCGPELTLGTELGRSAPIWLIKFTAPATALGSTPGPWNEWGADAQELYAILLFRIERAAARLRANGMVPVVRGIAMMQGESDAMQAELASAYEANLRTLVLRFRADLAAADLTGGATVPFAIGQISPLLPASFMPFVGQVRAAQADVAGSMPACPLIDTADLPLLADGGHFATPGVMELGRRMAAALQPAVAEGAPGAARLPAATPSLR